MRLPMPFVLLCDRSESVNPIALVSVARFTEAFRGMAHPVDYLESFDNDDVVDAITLFNVFTIGRN